ncbi:MAG: hypothetical protein ACHP9T_01480 [Caulobacterales bacterium]|jgi:hypothetical protein
MTEIARPLELITALGVAAVLLAAITRRYNHEARRLRRGLRAVLGGEPQGVLVDLKRGRAIGLNFRSKRVAVVWDAGAWGLLYGLDELEGAQVIVDSAVVGFAYRGATSRPLDPVGAGARRVAMRFMFDDPTYPDFAIDLWRRKDGGHRDEPTQEAALAEASHWLARIEALLGRPRNSWWEGAPAPQASAVPEPEPQASPASGRRTEPFDRGSLRDEDAA